MGERATLVLVIEDDEAIRSNLIDLFSAEGFECMGAKDGYDGLDVARRLRPAAIVCDLRMPHLDGLAVLDLVRGDPQLWATPFIVLTAHAERGDARRALRRGADDYVVKPFECEALVETVRARVRLRRGRSRRPPPTTPGRVPSSS